MTYNKPEDQCWLRRCVNEAYVLVMIKGKQRKVCRMHAKTYGSSQEQK